MIALVIFSDAVIEFLKREGRKSRAKKIEHRTKLLIERSQEIIDDHLGRINALNLWENVYQKTQNCVGEIVTKKGGKPRWILRDSGSEYYHRSMPAEWRNLANHIDELMLEKAVTVQQENERQEALAHRKKLFDDNWDLVSKFLEITERKVSIFDEYGEENWDALPEEIVTVTAKIGKRMKLPVSEKEVRAYLAGDGQWISERLEAGFREYHAKLKARPARTVAVNALSGVEFETWIAKLLKEKGFEVQGTPTTGDQGADLIAKKDGKIVIIQAKCYQGTVGNKAVQEVIGALAYYGGDEGWVVTNAAFTPSAKALAQKTNVRLVDGSMLNNGAI
jgi:restriction endonuclease Mrr